LSNQKSVVTTLMLNSLLVMPPVTYMFAWLATVHDRINMSAQLPGIVEVVTHIVCFLLAEELMFFYSHWLLHSP